jgi:toluene monooxygenase system protein E
MGLRTLVGQKTYSHLLGNRRVPSAYEIATSDLLWYVRQGFAIRTPVTRWYDRYQGGTPLRATDWEAFADPAATTYASYTKSRAGREVHADGLLKAAAEWDRGLATGWQEALCRALGVLRYPRHALMMAAGYVGSLAPSGRITAAAAFQAGDELRHVHRIAERAAQLGDVDTIAAHGRADWQADPDWQPLRALLERLLVTYDWGEALVALNLVVKPIVDAVALGALATRAAEAHDTVTAGLLRSLDEDAAWQRAWTAALVGVAVTQVPENRSVLEGWIAAWRGPAAEACHATARALRLDAGSALAAHDDLLASCNLRGAA